MIRAQMGQRVAPERQIGTGTFGRAPYQGTSL